MNPLNERLGQFMAAREIDRMNKLDVRVVQGSIRIEYGGLRVPDLAALRPSVMMPDWP